MTVSRRSSFLPTIGCVLLVLVGGALLWLPFRTQSALDDWKTHLRASGVPARAVVADRVTKDGGNRTSPSTTMFVGYELSGRTYEQEIGCVEVCRQTGEAVSIWVNPADPTDFVTDFDQLSGHRGRVQGVLGAAGFVLLAVAVPLTLSRIPFARWLPRRTRARRPAAPSPGRGGVVGRSKHKRSGRR